METVDFIAAALYVGVIVLMAPPLGFYLAVVFEDGRHPLKPVFGPVERIVYRLSGVNPSEDMSAKTYSASLLWFSIIGITIVFLMQKFQSILPLNPEHLPDVGSALALNTAISFVTNTNWQAYSGESTLSYFVQMFGLTVQNFVSAAAGGAVAVAVIRGFARRESGGIGNFWVDMTRITVYVLLPLALIYALFLISQGVVQSFSPYVHATGLEGGGQVIPLGPAASQIAIKMLGSNGGGFFGVNAAHPFENPTPLSNSVQILSILLIPAAFVFMFGKMVGDRRQGWAIFASMMILFLAGLSISLYAEHLHNPAIGTGVAMEGKEVRFGVAESVVWSVATTAVSNGSVNAMQDSMSPLSGGVALMNIMLGEVIFGGVGAGLYGMLAFVILTVFLAGLMVGRTPEYLGKKIEAFEVKMAVIAVLAPSAVILAFAALSVLIEPGLTRIANPGPHGLSEILYAFSSAAGNNGSAFAGLGVNTNYYNGMLSVAMLIGRFAVIFPLLAAAGSLAKKRRMALSSGVFPTHGPLFVTLLISVILIIGVLGHLPALSLGPIAEHLLEHAGRLF